MDPWTSLPAWLPRRRCGREAEAVCAHPFRGSERRDWPFSDSRRRQKYRNQEILPLSGALLRLERRVWSTLWYSRIESPRIPCRCRGQVAFRLLAARFARSRRQAKKAPGQLCPRHGPKCELFEARSDPPRELSQQIAEIYHRSSRRTIRLKRETPNPSRARVPRPAVRVITGG